MVELIKTCPIWGNEYRAQGTYDPETKLYEVEESERTFSGYKIIGQLLDSFVRPMPDSEKARLTTWLIDQWCIENYRPRITFRVCQGLISKQPLPVHVRADRLLTFISCNTRSQHFGKFVHFQEIWNKLIAWSESTDQSEVQFFLEYLEEKGWLERAPLGPQRGSNVHWRVSVEGHARVDEHLNDENTINSHQSSLSMRDDESTTKVQTTEDYDHDFFICHASEDKDDLVRELAELLRAKGSRVWYDEFTMKVGSRLRREIDRGLVNSRFGIVVVSEHFFAKEWPQKELDGLFSLDTQDQNRILPIWHKVTKDEVARRSPTLADIVALNTGIQSIGEIADELLAMVP